MTTEATMSSTYASEVAFFNKQRFNEAVARGDYPCAPKVEGRARVFTARDVMGIWLYGHLIDDGIPPAKAGDLACQFVNVLKFDPDIEEVLIVRDAFRRRHVVAPQNLESFKKVSLAGSSIISIETWDLRQQHKNIAHQFAKLAARHVHPDDAED
ncbi:hypothetical protein [Paracoccus sp. DMF]|uniref:hypothetical protein n=1 Tax=Paracoccus sp. DMF TaxID=400837 RepID=UPI001102D0A9|nr:hypothetical protein [Paracoccus sp. DMF]MCV2446672.1 hypothetical protein [Paracoccus sp. DMF]